MRGDGDESVFERDSGVMGVDDARDAQQRPCGGDDTKGRGSPKTGPDMAHVGGNGLTERVRPRRRILLVDDSRDMRFLVKRMLQREHEWSVREASCGAEAIEISTRESFDVMLVDSSLGDMHGADVVVAVRARQPELRVVSFSGSTDPADKKRLDQAGVVEYLPKSARREPLLRLLQRGPPEAE
ncbi:MAG: response regulator [Deltaproteobacteria bacterium]|nr:response regulator [Deltaproteobacteria bacterium]